MSDLAALILEAQMLAGARHPCAVHGHLWQFTGCRPCDCDPGGCPLPVHKCSRCGDYDYGDNDDAAAIIKNCLGATR